MTGRPEREEKGKGKKTHTLQSILNIDNVLLAAAKTPPNKLYKLAYRENLQKRKQVRQTDRGDKIYFKVRVPLINLRAYRTFLF